MHSTPENIQQLIEQKRQQLRQLLSVDTPSQQQEQHIRLLMEELLHLESQRHQQAKSPLLSKPMLSESTWERLIGNRLLGWAGIVLLIIGLLWLLAYAIQKEWISPIMRIGMGYVSSAVCIAIGWRAQQLSRRYAALWVGAAAVVAFISALYAIEYYQLNDIYGILLILGNAAVFVYYAMRYQEEAIASIGFLGGYLALIPLQGVGIDDVMTFTYIALLNTAITLLSLRMKWWRTQQVTFLISWLLLFVWVMFEAGFRAGSLSVRTYKILTIVLWHHIIFQSILLIQMRRHIRHFSVFLIYLFINILIPFLLVKMLFNQQWQIAAIAILWISMHLFGLKRLLQAELASHLQSIWILWIAFFLPDFVHSLLSTLFHTYYWGWLQLNGVQVFIIALMWLLPYYGLSEYRQKGYWLAGALFVLLAFVLSIDFPATYITAYLLVQIACLAGIAYLAQYLPATKEVRTAYVSALMVVCWFLLLKWLNLWLPPLQASILKWQILLYLTLIMTALLRRYFMNASAFDQIRKMSSGILWILFVALFIGSLFEIEEAMYLILTQDLSVAYWFLRYVTYASWMSLLYWQRHRFKSYNTPKKYLQFNFHAIQLSRLLIASLEMVSIYLVLVPAFDPQTYSRQLDLSLRFILSAAWLLIATIALYRGIKKHDARWRQTGVLLFILVICKILVVDIYASNPLTRIVLFILGGIVLMIATYLYQRYKHLLEDKKEASENPSAPQV